MSLSGLISQQRSAALQRDKHIHGTFTDILPFQRKRVLLQTAEWKGCIKQEKEKLCAVSLCDAATHLLEFSSPHVCLFHRRCHLHQQCYWLLKL